MAITRRPELSPEERALPLSKYYDLPLNELGPREQEIIDYLCPLDASLAIKPENWLDLLEPTGYQKMEYGFCHLPDGSAYIAVYTVYPNCTPMMLKWYFRWLNIPPKDQPKGKMGYDNIRYKIWNPSDHVGHGFVNGKDRTDGIWTVESLDLGQGDPKDYCVRNSIDLRACGLTEEKEAELNKAGCFVDSAFEKWFTMDEKHEPLGGTHLCLTISRQSPLGYMEKCSREWIGWGLKDGKPVRDYSTPDYMFTDEYLRKVITHSTIEAQQLSIFLRPLYDEYHEKPDDAD